jgi:hypothetical protein
MNLPFNLEKGLPTSPGVYLLIHRQTGDTYIGSAQNIHERIRSHFHNMKRDKCTAAMKALVRERGADFEVVILQLTTDTERVRAEARWIAERKPTLNRARINGRQLERDAKHATAQLNCRLTSRLVRRMERFSQLHRFNPSCSQIVIAAVSEWLDANEPKLPPPRKAKG